MDKATIKRNQGTEMRADGIYRDGKKIRGGNFAPVQIEKHNAKWAPKKAAPAPEPVVEETVELEEVMVEVAEPASSEVDVAEEAPAPKKKKGFFGRKK